MNRKSFTNRVASAAIATCLALGASVAFAQGDSAPADDDASKTIGTEACKQIGCPNGSRLCGSVEWAIEVMLPVDIPIPWTFKGTQTCYEQPYN